MIRLALIAALFAGCKVNDYCVDCVPFDAANGDGGDDGGGGLDSGADASCIASGAEECDGEDNDCNGLVDDGVLPGADIACSNQMGECAGGMVRCTAGELRCDKQPSPEVCDAKDNNCNGQVDDGNPGGGATCGTNVGECVTGITACVAATGTIECFGEVDRTADPELCNAKDDDCDGNFDEGLASLGACGPVTDEGECTIGMLTCQGGAPVCMNAVLPAFEACNSKDDDCDAKVDEVYDLQTDPNNCGACGVLCPSAANANTRCVAGDCGFACKAGYHDLDPGADGCDYGPCFATGSEECDGADNDCDGSVDEGLTAPAICQQGGACGTTTATCTGAGGWACNYPGTVQFPETRCDGADNDCDTRVDEGQPNLGDTCDDGRLGVCKGAGTFACDTGNLDGPAVCNITSPGQAAPDPGESCDGKDNDCDGDTDEDATDNFVEVRDAGNVVLFRIYAYEASRPDATASSVGTVATRSCSRAGVLPWSSVTEVQAAAACAAVDPAKNSRLCTAAEWQRACEGATATAYPYGNSYQASACNGNDYDPDCALPDDDRALATGAAHGCPTKPGQSACVSAAGAFDLSGNLKEWTATQVAAGVYSIRGGAYDTTAGGMTCQFDFVSATPTFTFANLGFRCCADP